MITIENRAFVPVDLQHQQGQGFSTCNRNAGKMSKETKPNNPPSNDGNLVINIISDFND